MSSGTGICEKAGGSPAQDLLTRGLVWWLALLALLPGLPGAWTGVVWTYELVGWVLLGSALGIRLVYLVRVTRDAKRGRRRTGPEGGVGSSVLVRFPPRLAVWAGAALFAWLAFRTWETGVSGSRPLWMALGIFCAAALLPRRSLRLFPAAFHTVGWGVLLLTGLEVLGVLPAGLFHAWRDRPLIFLGQERLSGTFFHPNLLAFFLLAQWLNGFGVLRMRRFTGRSGWPVYLFSLLTLLALSLTLSRSVLIGGGTILAFGAVWMVIRRRTISVPRFDYLAMGALGLAIGGIGTSQLWLGRIVQLEAMKEQARETFESRPLSSAPLAGSLPGRGIRRLSLAQFDRMSRVEIWRDGYQVFRSSPAAGLGVGAFYRYGPGQLHTHNVLLELAVSGGGVALALLTVALWLAFRRVGLFRWWHILLVLPFATGIFDCFLFFNYVLFLTAFAFGLAARGNEPVEGLAVSRPRLVFGGSLDWVLPKTEWQGRIATTVAFGVFVGVLFFATPRPAPDFYAYYAATQYTNATGKSPYLAWPSHFEVPKDHPLAAYAIRLHGHQPVRFFYPPTALLLLSPLSRISDAGTASLVWFGMEILLVGLLAAGASKLAGYRGIHWLVLLAIVSHSPVSNSILFGQISLPLAVVGLWVWLLHREGRSFAAGLLLSVGIALKAYPLVWLGFLLVRPRGWWRFVLGCVLGMGVLGGLSVAIYGTGLWWAFMHWVVEPLNTYRPSPSMSVCGLTSLLGFSSHSVADWVLLAMLSVAFATGGWVHRKRGGSPDVLAVGVVALSVLASPVAWYHYACLVTGFLAAFVGRMQREGMTPLAVVSAVVLLVTGFEFTGASLASATVRASLGFVVLALLPWLLLYLEGLDAVTWIPFVRRKEMCHESAETT